MTWREKVLVRVLLLVARTFADDPVVEEEIKRLATHVQVGPEDPPYVLEHE